MEVDENIFKIKLDSLENSCRVCITSNSEKTEIFNEDHSEIIEKIEFCSGILLKQEYGYPTQICYDCLKNLSVAYAFKNKCIFTDNILRTIHDKIKTEPIYDEENDYNENVLSPANFDTEVKEENKESCEQSTKPRRSLRKTKQTRTKEHEATKRKVKDKRKRVETINQCNQCNLQFQNKTEMILHKRELHWGKREYVCEVCGRVCSSSTYHKHIQSHGTLRYICDYCGYGTIYRGDLIKHVRRHLGNTKPYKCDKCPRAYYTCSSLNSHKRNTHNGERRHCCTLCGKRFFDRTKLKRHIDSHNGVKRFECSECSASYTRRCYLKIHLLKQHNINSPRMKPGRRRMTVLI